MELTPLIIVIGILSEKQGFPERFVKVVVYLFPDTLCTRIFNSLEENSP